MAIAVAAVLAMPGAALAASGDRDTSFDDDGAAAVDLGGFDGGNAVAIQDGKIIVAGDVNDVAFIVRLDTDGDLDLTFGGGDGHFLVDLGAGTSAHLYSVAVLPGGRVLSAGYYNDSGGNAHLLVVRLNANGTPDATFGDGDGILTKSYGVQGAAAYEVLLLPDGKFMLAGGFYPEDDCEAALWRFKANGKLDKTFSGDGLARLSVGEGCDEFGRMLRMSDGDIVAGGWGSVDQDGGYDVVLARFNPNGSIDTAFGWDGWVTHNPTAGTSEGVLGLASSGNKIMVGVSNAEVGGDGDVVLLRLKNNGGPDRTFGGGDGEVVIDLGGFELPWAMAQQSDGKFVVVGQRGPDLFVTRVNTNGALDTGFGTAGLATAAVPGQGEAVALQTNGRIVVAGRDGNFDMMVARFLP